MTSKKVVEYSNKDTTFFSDSMKQANYDEFSGRLLSDSELIAYEALSGLKSLTQLDAQDLIDNDDEDNEEETVTDKPEEGTNSAIVDENDKSKKRKIGSTISNYVSKKDIRHTYARAYIDAMNSGVTKLYEKVVQDIATKDVKLVSQMMNKVDLFPSTVEVVGSDVIVMLYDTFIKSIPDVYYELYSSKIRVFRNGESAVIIKMGLKGTKVFEMNGLPAGTDDSVVLKSTEPSNVVNEISSGIDKLKVTAEVTSKVPDPKSGKPVKGPTTTEKFGLGEVQSVKVPMSLIGTTTFDINE